MVGMWTGDGSSYEVRFRQKGKMTVAVLHATVFTLFVEPDGTVSGLGTVVYDVDPNLCGIAALAEQVNQAIDMMTYVMDFWKYGEIAGKVYKEFLTIAAKEAGKAAAQLSTKATLQAAARAGWKVGYDQISKWWKSPLEKIGKEIRGKMVKGKAAKPDKGCPDSGRSVGGFGPGYMPGMMNVPGVTKVQYEYKGLANGPEERLIYIKGHVEPSSGGYRMVLEQDGPVMQGGSQLFVQYTVNYVTEKKPFPCWSPFLRNPGKVALSGEDASVSFKEQGEHRNGVSPWQEYIYVWNAKKINESDAE